MKEKNEPAFPCLDSFGQDPDSSVLALRYEGMSLRDWFAGMAMQGLISAGGAVSGDRRVLSVLAFMYADNMIAEREGLLTHENSNTD